MNDPHANSLRHSTRTRVKLLAADVADRAADDLAARGFLDLAAERRAYADLCRAEA